MEYKKKFEVSDFTDLKPSEASHKEILDWANEKRPYCPSDFKKRHFIDDLEVIMDKRHKNQQN